MDNKNYNSQRNKLILPEYGRHIQEMANSLKMITDKEERTLQAYTVVAVMGNLNTHLRDTTDFRHKLWDHLFIMTDFDLDVDSPYPINSMKELEYNPQKLPYPSNKITYKQYGNNIRRVIDEIKGYEHEDIKNEIALDISKFMKFKSYEYNQEYPSDEVIIHDIKRFSGGDISLEDDSLNSTKINHRKQNAKSTSSDRRSRQDTKYPQRNNRQSASNKNSNTAQQQTRKFYKKNVR